MYDITSGNNEKLFEIEKRSGKIKVYKSLVSDVDKVVTLFVSANDNGGLVPNHKSVNSAKILVYIIGDDKIGIISIGSSANYLHQQVAELER